MMCTTHFRTVMVLAGAIFVLGARAGEAPPANDADAKNKALEERVRVLEKRLAELESKNFQNSPPQNRFSWQDNTDELFDRMRREMMESSGAFDWNNLFGQNPALGVHRPQTGHKPMLGVGVDQISDELKARYKNEVSEGAFVISVYPGSPAEKAGILVGDAITSFDKKAIASPRALIDAVKAAAPGDHDIVLARRGESLMMKVHLAAEEPAAPGPFKRDGAANSRTRTEIKVSALELPDSLAAELKLSGDQKKKMTEILNNHAKALSDEFAQTSTPRRSGGVFGFSMQGNLNELAKKHADNAATDLAGVLNADQLKQWNDYRESHSSVSFSQTMQMGDTLPPQGGRQFKLEEEDKGVTF